MPVDEDIRYPSGLGEHGRSAFLDYLDATASKAFVMSDDGRYDWRARRESDAEAVAQAVEACRRTGARQCHPVMIDDKPVAAR
jgi:hypothetical protein